MATNIFSIGQSALQAAMAAQATTSHNISNATTPGYNRQEVVQSSAGGINYGYGFVGQGTQVTEIKRVYNDFLTKQALASQTSASSLDAYYSEISQINNMVADTKAGLSPSLQDFFAAIQNLASNPNTQASRQSVLSQASTLVARVTSINDQLSASSASVNSQITSTVTTINSYAQQLAQLNKAIVNAIGTGGGQQPNDLLDQRDQLVAELNKYVKITTVPQDTGAVSVFIGTGQALVTGENVTQLAVTNSPTDVSRLQIGQVNGSTTSTIPDSFFYDGGSLGGLLKYRSETLDPTQNALGRIAIALGTAFNQQQQLGLDQNGNPGTNMFNVSSPNLIGYPTNTGTTDLKTTISDPSALTTSDYTLTYDGTNYTFTRLSDNTKTVKAATDFPVTLDGVTYSNGAAAPGPYAPAIPNGNIYKIQPTANGAAGFSLALNNTAAGHGSADLDLDQRHQQRQRQHGGRQYRQCPHLQHLTGSDQVPAGFVGVVHCFDERGSAARVAVDGRLERCHASTGCDLFQSGWHRWHGRRRRGIPLPVGHDHHQRWRVLHADRHAQHVGGR